MVFSSSVFLFIFLPVVFILYYMIPNLRIRNGLLTVVSLFFYAFGEPVYVLIMLASIVMNYVWGLLVVRQGAVRKAAIVLSVVTNIGLLVVFKYTDFLISNVNALFSLEIPMTGIELPIGISFFTFQAMSYVIDTYRDPSLCQKNLGHLMLYISFFPQLIAGPIVRYSDIAEQIRERNASSEDIANGLRRFIFGLAKKLLISNVVGYAADQIFGMNGGNAIAAWSGAIFYCLQIYYDFSGYSDMAIGLGHMFGFHFKENFRYPYAATSIQDFWRRWHISLSEWFKSYLYIPLGGNRKGEVRRVINRYIVFFMTGLWHGASWNFVLWGLMHGTFLVLEGGPLKVLKKHKVISRVYTLVVVAIAFVLFRAETLTQAGTYIATMFTGWTLSGEAMTQFLTLLTPWFLFITAMGIVFSVPVKEWIERLEQRSQVWTYVSYVVSMALFILCVLNLSSSTFNPFIYFRF